MTPWKWKSLSRVPLFATLWTMKSMEFSRPEYWEWVAFPFSRGSSQTRDQTQVSCIAVGSLPAEPQGKPKNTGVGSLSLLQWMFPIQESNWGLLHCRQILYQLRYQGSPIFLRIRVFCKESALLIRWPEHWSFSISPSNVSLVAQMVKNLPANARDMSLNPGSGRSPGEGNGNPLQYSCPGNPMNRGAWWTTVHGVTQESDMT